MTRRCTCDRYHSPDYQPGDCRLCWLYRHWYAPLPCVHEGHTRPPPEGKLPIRTYLGCDAGMGDPPGVVCRCNCNERCPKYEPDQPDNSLAGGNIPAAPAPSDSVV